MIILRTVSRGCQHNLSFSVCFLVPTPATYRICITVMKTLSQTTQPILLTIITTGKFMICPAFFLLHTAAQVVLWLTLQFTVSCTQSVIMNFN